LSEQIKCMVLIMADFVRALGMMSQNMQRQALGQSMAYSDDSFYVVAEIMENRINDMVGTDKKEG